MLIVGDGSGSGWDAPCGWASCLIDRTQPDQHGRRFFYGGMNAGSVNMAEALPYGQALAWYDNTFGKQKLEQMGSLRVHILTDSQVTANYLIRVNSLEAALPRKHIPVWAPMREYRRCGYLYYPHWAPRATTQFNWAADIIAGLTRSAVAGVCTKEPTEITRAAVAAINSVEFLSGDAIPVAISPYDLHPSIPGTP